MTQTIQTRRMLTKSDLGCPSCPQFGVAVIAGTLNPDSSLLQCRVHTDLPTASNFKAYDNVLCCGGTW